MKVFATVPNLPLPPHLKHCPCAMWPYPTSLPLPPQRGQVAGMWRVTVMVLVANDAGLSIISRMLLSQVSLVVAFMGRYSHILYLYLRGHEKGRESCDSRPLCQTWHRLTIISSNKWPHDYQAQVQGKIQMRFYAQRIRQA